MPWRKKRPKITRAVLAGTNHYRDLLVVDKCLVAGTSQALATYDYVYLDKLHMMADTNHGLFWAT